MVRPRTLRKLFIESTGFARDRSYQYIKKTHTSSSTRCGYRSMRKEWNTKHEHHVVTIHWNTIYRYPYDANSPHVPIHALFFLYSYSHFNAIFLRMIPHLYSYWILVKFGGVLLMSFTLLWLDGVQRPFLRSQKL